MPGNNNIGRLWSILIISYYLTIKVTPYFTIDLHLLWNTTLKHYVWFYDSWSTIHRYNFLIHDSYFHVTTKGDPKWLSCHIKIVATYLTVDTINKPILLWVQSSNHETEIDSCNLSIQTIVPTWLTTWPITTYLYLVH